MFKTTFLSVFLLTTAAQAFPCGPTEDFYECLPDDHFAVIERSEDFLALAQGGPTERLKPRYHEFIDNTQGEDFISFGPGFEGSAYGIHFGAVPEDPTGPRYTFAEANADGLVSPIDAVFPPLLFDGPCANPPNYEVHWTLCWLHNHPQGNGGFGLWADVPVLVRRDDPIKCHEQVGRAVGNWPDDPGSIKFECGAGAIVGPVGIGSSQGVIVMPAYKTNDFGELGGVLALQHKNGDFGPGGVRVTWDLGTHLQGFTFPGEPRMYWTLTDGSPAGEWTRPANDNTYTKVVTNHRSDVAGITFDSKPNVAKNGVALVENLFPDLDADGRANLCDQDLNGSDGTPGTVDGADYGLFFAAYQQGVPVTEAQAEADFDGDGVVSGADFATFFAAYQQGESLPCPAL